MAPVPTVSVSVAMAAAGRTCSRVFQHHSKRVHFDVFCVLLRVSVLVATCTLGRIYVLLLWWYYYCMFDAARVVSRVPYGLFRRTLG